LWRSHGNEHGNDTFTAKRRWGASGGGIGGLTRNNWIAYEHGNRERPKGAGGQAVVEKVLMVMVRTYVGNMSLHLVVAQPRE